ncbi:prenyltransferase/squalene oxidase repeat-containing protein [Paenibacillus sp. NPDC058071]|uniref:prenyltransferase/squalene oxidase repeat-containing protein n=1 Tax=Paenibacillus sp. NPDC058071 TaxID=3346326 RepID=UPI0036DC38D2
MLDRNKIRTALDQLADELLLRQSPDGAWRLCFDSGTMSDCYYIVTQRLFGHADETLIRRITDRILSRQYANGAWKVYPDEQDGNLDATVEAYYALLCSGYYQPNHPRLASARNFILEKGGLAAVQSMLTQALLAATSQAEWPKSLRIPLEAFFSDPPPLDIFSLSGHARVHLVPVLIMANESFSASFPGMPDLSNLYADESSGKSFQSDSTWIAALLGLIEMLGVAALLPSGGDAAKRRALQFLFDRMEPNGTLLTYSTATMLMMLALLSQNYSPSSPVITNMSAGIRSLLCHGQPHIQVASSEVWDTALLASAMRSSGLQPNTAPLERAGAYLQARQQWRRGDWARRAPNAEPGGWGFSDVNTLYPDVDDSAAALRAIRPYADRSSSQQEDWQRGLSWVLAMRNKDGGWPAFEREGDPLPIQFFAFEGAKDIALDPSTPDLTGRTLLFLVQELGVSVNNSWIERTVQWLLSQQRPDGSWYGRWGICYVHGTGAVVQALLAAGVADDHPAIRKAVKWLTRIQNEDGGWGESCLSDKKRVYIPLGVSTISQTAWALDALTAALPKPTKELEKGVQALLSLLERGARDPAYTYPTGSGLPGSVYIHYASNNYTWPMFTLSSILAKYS